MRTPVLHIHDTDDKIDAFMLHNMMSTASGEIVLHIVRGSRNIEIWRIGTEGPTREPLVASDGCGCP